MAIQFSRAIFRPLLALSRRVGSLVFLLEGGVGNFPFCVYILCVLRDRDSNLELVNPCQIVSHLVVSSTTVTARLLRCDHRNLGLLLLYHHHGCSSPKFSENIRHHIVQFLNGWPTNGTFNRSCDRGVQIASSVQLKLWPEIISKCNHD